MFIFISRNAEVSFYYFFCIWSYQESIFDIKKSISWYEKLDDMKKINPISWYKKKSILFLDIQNRIFDIKKWIYLNQKWSSDIKKWDWFLGIKNRFFISRNIE